MTNSSDHDDKEDARRYFSFSHGIKSAKIQTLSGETIVLPGIDEIVFGRERLIPAKNEREDDFRKAYAAWESAGMDGPIAISKDLKPYQTKTLDTGGTHVAKSASEVMTLLQMFTWLKPGTVAHILYPVNVTHVEIKIENKRLRIVGDEGKYSGHESLNQFTPGQLGLDPKVPGSEHITSSAAGMVRRFVLAVCEQMGVPVP